MSCRVSIRSTDITPSDGVGVGLTVPLLVLGPSTE